MECTGQPGPDSRAVAQALESAPPLTVEDRVGRGAGNDVQMGMSIWRRPVRLNKEGRNHQPVNICRIRESTQRYEVRESCIFPFRRRLSGRRSRQGSTVVFIGAYPGR
jgi:hypothetical protein